MARMTEARAAELIAEVGEAQREVQKIEARMNTVLARAKERFEKLAKQHSDAIEKATGQLYEWAEESKDELLDQDARTVTLATGSLVWRTNPPKVNVRNAKKAIEELERLGLDNLLRRTPELDKEAILKSPDAIGACKHLSIGQGETFYVKPFSTEIEAARPVKAVAASPARKRSAA